ncbi:MAG TPA: hypothetical protein VEI50_08815 [Nitrospiraceae bacterium]|nr:hypothetical protein [Nitrospiraceae bacterium]
MKPVGWEIRPLGWLLLVVLVALLVYLIYRRLQPPSAQPEGNS